MYNPPIRTTAFLLLGCLMLLATLLGIAGCSFLRGLDDRLWTSPAAPGEPGVAPGDPGQVPVPDQVPPILETAAGILALAGYGGMAAWIRKTSRNGRASFANLEARLKALEDTAA